MYRIRINTVLDRIKKMKPYIVFNADTGKIIRYGRCQDHMINAQAGHGESVMVAIFNEEDPDKFIIDSSGSLPVLVRTRE